MRSVSQPPKLRCPNKESLHMVGCTLGADLCRGQRLPRWFSNGLDVSLERPRFAALFAHKILGYKLRKLQTTIPILISLCRHADSPVLDLHFSGFSHPLSWSQSPNWLISYYHCHSAKWHRILEQYSVHYDNWPSNRSVDHWQRHPYERPTWDRGQHLGCQLPIPIIYLDRGGWEYW